MSVQVLRGIGVAAALFGVLIFGSIVGTIVTADVAVAQTLRIDVEGNRRVEADTIRSYFRVAPGERLDTAKIDAALKGLYATGLFQDVRITPGANRILVTVVENAVINRVAVRGQQESQGRAAFLGSSIEAARHLLARARAGGRAAHPRGLPALAAATT